MADTIGSTTGSTTGLNTSELLNKAASTIGVSPQMTSNLADRAQKIISSTGQIATEWGGSVMDQAAKIPGASRKVAVRVDQHARAHPWLHVGLAGVGFFTIGFFLGRSLSGSDLSIKAFGSKASEAVEEDGEQ